MSMSNFEDRNGEIQMLAPLKNSKKKKKTLEVLVLFYLPEVSPKQVNRAVSGRIQRHTHSHTYKNPEMYIETAHSKNPIGVA